MLSPSTPFRATRLSSILKGAAAISGFAFILAGCSQPEASNETEAPAAVTAPQAAQAASISSKPVSGEDAVKALNGVFGRHEGERGSHAKGFCISGSFTPVTDTPYSYFSSYGGQSVPVIGRFSIGGGNPEASDKGRSVRGIGIRLLPENTDGLDLVMISAPVFFAATAEQFIEFLTVRAPDPVTGKKNASAIAAFNAANPNIMPHVDYLAQTRPPASYATTPYFSTHAFLFEQNEGAPQPARWHFEPVTGFQGLTAQQEEQFPTSFLRSELEARLMDGGIAEWIAYLQPAQDGDSLTDPSSPWTGPRETFIEIGRLQINGLGEAGNEDECTGLVFDPNNLPLEISPSEDPILALRRTAYSFSFGERSQ